MSSGLIFNDIYENVDNPKTFAEKTQGIRKYIFGFFPSNFCTFLLVWILIPISFLAFTMILGRLSCKLFSKSQHGFYLPQFYKMRLQLNFQNKELFNTSIIYRLQSVLLFYNLGTRCLGTPANIATENWLIQELGNIISNYSSPNKRIELTTQSFSSLYSQNSKNILVRVSDSSRDANMSSLLLSAHFDSAAMSPGAGVYFFVKLG